MKRLSHGEVLPLHEEFDGTRIDSQTWPFGFMFPDLQRHPSNLLKTSSHTVRDLKELGSAMGDPGESVIPGVEVPSIHTFLGQFIDHEMTLERGSANVSLKNPEPLPLDRISKEIVNSRSPDFDLDSVYGPDINGMMSPRDPTNEDKMLLGQVELGRGLPTGKDVWNDFPRLADGSPQIGDSRNDENVIVTQLHVAFLRAHNAIVDRGFKFEEARKLLTRHFQWIIVNEFLEQIADPKIVRKIRFDGPRFFDPPAGSFFMPLEFSVAAYRFGHSKVRAAYDNLNDIQIAGGLDLLFRPSEKFLGHWIVSWPSFLKAADPDRLPRRIDTSITEHLMDLEIPVERNLAVRNLFRGYILRMPTGQAVAKAMGLEPLTKKQIYSAASEITPLPESPSQSEVLAKTDFLTRTPLWFYILAEAASHHKGKHLGPVGSTIVAEVIIGVLRKSTYSILSDPDWRPTLGDTPGEFNLEALLKLAGVY